MEQKEVVDCVKIDKEEWINLKANIRRTECRLREIDNLITVEPHSFFKAGIKIGISIECLYNLAHQLEQIEEFDQ